jgi:hypothetical protein
VVPCFAAPRLADLGSQTDPSNAFTITADPMGGVVYRYCGCWLDINQLSQNVVPVSPIPPNDIGPFASTQSVLQWIGSQHQCLVAEIFYDDDPVHLGQTPASSDKFAQRNLAIVPSANPGSPGSRRIPQTLIRRFATPRGFVLWRLPDARPGAR